LNTPNQHSMLCQHSRQSGFLGNLFVPMLVQMTEGGSFLLSGIIQIARYDRFGAIADRTPRNPAAAFWPRAEHPRARRPASRAVRSSATGQSRTPRRLPRRAGKSRTPCTMSGYRVGQGVRARRKIVARRFLGLSNTSTPAARSTRSQAVMGQGFREPAAGMHQGNVECPHRAVGQVGSRSKASRSPAVRYLRVPPAVCSCMPIYGAGERAESKLLKSRNNL
jgi:hypothetical protein